MSCHESNDACCSPACRTKAAYFIGALVVILLGVGLNAMLKKYTATGANEARANRAKERSKALAEVRQSTSQELTTTGVMDKAKGQFRIPISAAMDLTLKEYQTDAAAARKGFVKRVEDWAKPPSFE